MSVANKRLVFGNLTLRPVGCNSEHLLNDPGNKNAADERVIVVAEWYGIGSRFSSSIEHDNDLLLSSPSLDGRYFALKKAKK